MCLRFTVVLVFYVWCFTDFGVTTASAYGNCTEKSCGPYCISKCSTDPPKGICPSACKPRCVCNSGYVYNSTEHCVLPKDCK